MIKLHICNNDQRSAEVSTAADLCALMMKFMGENNDELHWHDKFICTSGARQANITNSSRRRSVRWADRQMQQRRRIPPGKLQRVARVLIIISHIRPHSRRAVPVHNSSLSQTPLRLPLSGAAVPTPRNVREVKSCGGCRPPPPPPPPPER